MTFEKCIISLSGRLFLVFALMASTGGAILPFPRVSQQPQLEVLSEYTRTDPFGNIVEADRGKGERENTNKAQPKPFSSEPRAMAISLFN